MTHLSKLVLHCTWANQAWITHLGVSRSADEHLMALMSHVLLGERAWFQRIAGSEADREIWRVLSLGELRQVQEEHGRTYAHLLEEDLGRRIEYRRFTGDEYTSSVADILLHLCTHGVHHRGQMTSHASRAGLGFPNTDFINFCIATGV